MNIRLSKFEQYLLSISICVSIIIYYLPSLNYLNDSYIDFKITIGSGVIFVLLLTLTYLADDLNNIIAFKFKIIEDSLSYETQVLTLTFLLIPTWKHLKTELFCRYYFGKIYNSENEALISIKNYKKELEENRIKFFKRPKKSNKKITYV